jgi:hypothetical protein
LIFWYSIYVLVILLIAVGGVEKLRRRKVARGLNLTQVGRHTTRNTTWKSSCVLNLFPGIAGGLPPTRYARSQAARSGSLVECEGARSTTSYRFDAGDSLRPLEPLINVQVLAVQPRSQRRGGLRLSDGRRVGSRCVSARYLCLNTAVVILACGVNIVTNIIIVSAMVVVVVRTAEEIIIIV